MTLDNAKKVLIVNTHIPWGGLGQFTITLTKALGKEGFKVFGLVTHSNEDLFDDFLKHTVATKYLGNRSKLFKYFQIIKYISNINPDFIIINNNAPTHYILPFIKKSKIISIIHSDADDFYRIAKINDDYVDSWVVPTPRIKKGFIEYQNSINLKSRVNIIPHGVAQSTSRSVKGSGEVFNIVFVGALYVHKGVDLLPEIFLRFHQKCPSTHLTIIGNGDKFEEIYRQFESLGLIDDVTFTGVLSSNLVRDKLKLMDVMLFPTRLEAFGLVIAEAMMEGVVPLVTLLPGITDAIVSNNITGFLIEKDDIDDFVLKLTFLFQNREELLKISSNCKKVALEEFTPDRMAIDYMDLFKMLEKTKQ